jgi:hypothetical protein
MPGQTSCLGELLSTLNARKLEFVMNTLHMTGQMLFIVESLATHRTLMTHRAVLFLCPESLYVNILKFEVAVVILLVR